MDSTATLNSSEMSSLWASKRRMILSARSANHLRTAVKSYPLFRVCFSPARIPKVSPKPSLFCWEVGLRIEKHVMYLVCQACRDCPEQKTLQWNTRIWICKSIFYGQRFVSSVPGQKWSAKLFQLCKWFLCVHCQNISRNLSRFTFLWFMLF